MASACFGLAFSVRGEEVNQTFGWRRRRRPLLVAGGARRLAHDAGRRAARVAAHRHHRLE